MELAVDISALFPSPKNRTQGEIDIFWGVNAPDRLQAWGEIPGRFRNRFGPIGRRAMRFRTKYL